MRQLTAMQAGRWFRALALVPPLACAGACQPVDVTVGRARLAQADGVAPAPPGPTIEVGPDGPAPAAPVGGGPVRIAADRDAIWAEIVRAAQAVTAAGGEPVLLVATRARKIAAMPAAAPAPETTEGVILLEVRADGTACVRPPGSIESWCIKRRLQDGRVERALVREHVRAAVKNGGGTHVHVRAVLSLRWGDVVRAVDGARTCCPGTTMTVSVAEM